MLLIVELLFIVLLSMILFMLYRNERALSKKTTPQATIEGYWKGRERRQCVRFKKDLEVSYTVEKKAHLKSNGKAVDISESGIRLLLSEKLPEGAILDLEIIFSDPKKLVEVEGEVMWSEEAFGEKELLARRLFHTGVKFLNVKTPPGEMLSDTIRSLSLDLEA